MRADVHEYEPDDAGACHVCGRGRGDLQHAEPAPRVGGVVVTSDTFPGSWGWGSTEAEAVEEWKRHGGRGARLVLAIDPYWSAARVDWMGQVWADVTDPASADVPRKDRPPVIMHAERVGPRGKRAPIDL
jgi:hypothetical protein